jgi:hypothetical protein
MTVRIKAERLAGLAAVASGSDLQQYVQAAIELEHATIPTYLTALFSIKPGANSAAAEIISSVVKEEMLHMTIAANLLNAIGGTPDLAHPGFIPVFPGPLPMGIADGLTVELRKLSRGLVSDTFLVIEEPEAPQTFVIEPPARVEALVPDTNTAAASDATIGRYYEILEQMITDLGEGIFTGDPARQVVDNTWFPSDQLFPINSVASAIRAIEVIVDQGEGTPSNPEQGGKPAHYYRFAQLVYARMLVPDATEPTGWSYSGAPVGIDPSGVWNLLPNAKVADYGVGTRAAFLAEQANRTYTNLLRALDETFNGKPELLKASLSLMFELRVIVSELVSIPLPGTGVYAAPTFEFTPV